MAVSIPYLVPAQFQESILSEHKLAGSYDNPIPTRFLALHNCSKIPALS
jgi:hypothetical protein